MLTSIVSLIGFWILCVLITLFLCTVSMVVMVFMDCVINALYK